MVSDFFLQEIATITYRSGPEWDIRFSRQLRAAPSAAKQRIPALCPDFLIETYLDHQASS
jgi:homoserine acetyltransferase